MTIRLIDNFINQEQLTQINEYVDEKGYSYGWKSNMNKEYKHWNLHIGGSKSYRDEIIVEQKDIQNPLIWNIWERINVHGNKLIRIYSNAYTYGTEGAIHKDSDNPNSKTHMIYINEVWNKDWAGETCFFENDDILGAILPKPGRFIEFPGTIEHAARSVSKFCPVVRKVLVYKSI